MEEHEVNRLLNRLIDGSISREDFTRIQAAMRVNPEVRAEYYDLIGVDLMLSERYEVPTHISVQAKTMDDHWLVRQSKRKMITGVAWAAAACILLSVGGFMIFRDRQPAATLTASVDCSYSIDGTPRSITTLKKDEVLTVDTGVMSMAIGTHVEACVEGPAKVRLIAHEGKLEIQEGSVFLQILPGGKGFEVHTPAGIIRDIGTKFGVHVAASGTVETHVTAGTVEIDRDNGEQPRQIRAGESAVWTRGGTIRGGRYATGRFIQSLPWEDTVFADDFDDRDGTLLDKKAPDIGLPWVAQIEMNPTTVMNGRIDTSTGWRTLQARFRDEQQSNRRKVYVVNFSTRVPANIWDKAAYLDAAERITFQRKGDGPLFSLVARASRNHHWQLKNELDATYSRGTRTSALQPHDLTLSYDSGTGEVRFYEGSSTEGTLLDKLVVEAGAALDSVLISNDEGGDVALEDLTVRILTYPQNGERQKSPK
jgi:hypothetical protein